MRLLARRAEVLTEAMDFDDLSRLLGGDMEVVESEPERLTVRRLGRLIEIHAIRAFEQPWLLLVAEIDAVVSHEAALRRNATMAVGAIALRDGRCIVQASLPLARLTPDNLVGAVTIVAAEANQIQGQHSVSITGSTLFLNFTE